MEVTKHGNIRVSRKVPKRRSIVYKTRNVRILLTNHGLVTENGPTCIGTSYCGCPACVDDVALLTRCE